MSLFRQGPSTFRIASSNTATGWNGHLVTGADDTASPRKNGKAA
jgi:hypothetical protein